MLDWDDPLLARFNFPATAQERVEAVILNVSGAMDRYCNRNLARATYDKVVKVLTTGDILLPAYPVESVTRVCGTQVPAISVASTAAIATAHVTTSSVILQHLNNGALTPIIITFEDAPTIEALVDEINDATTFSASVIGDYGPCPASDLVSGTTLNGAGNLPMWQASNVLYQMDADKGILHVGEGTYGYADTVACLSRDRVKVTWTGGYDDEGTFPWPDELKGVAADLVGYFYDGLTGAMTSENFAGKYSYTVGAIDVHRLPITAKKVLDTYKNRTAK